jgi:predicted peptidase
MILVAAGGPAVYAAKPKPPKLPEELKLSTDPGKQVYKAQVGGYYDGQFAVYVPKAYSDDKPMPLVLSAHGAGGNGPDEMGQWEAPAEEYKFLVVCPSFATSLTATPGEGKRPQFQKDISMLDEVLRRVFGSFNVDRKHTMFTGFSGGGNATYYLGMAHPEYFTSLCFRSANYHGTMFNLTQDFTPWRDRPIYIFWGDNDHEIIIKPMPNHEPEGPAGLRFLRVIGCRNIKHEILPGGGHDSRVDLAAKWFAKEVVPITEKPTKRRRPTSARTQPSE